jgi:heme/copper-type cytochrome/quinol oxidase subunit 4
VPAVTENVPTRSIQTPRFYLSIHPKKLQETMIKTSKFIQAVTIQLILRFYLSIHMDNQRETTTKISKLAQAVTLQLILQFYLRIHLEKQRETTAKTSKLDQAVTLMICIWEVLDLNCSWVCSFPVPVRKSYARIAPSH